VIVTLIYLAIQTRLTRKAAEESAKFASQEALRAVPTMYARYRTLTANPELAQIIVKARGTEQLTDTEQLLFSTIFEELIYVAATSYQSSNLSASEHDKTGDVEFVTSVFNANPKAIDIWHGHSHIAQAISPEFVRDLNLKLEGKP